MAGWDRVRWTEAGQITARLGWDDIGADATMSPESYFNKLREEGRLHDAVFFLAQALPRFEAVAWAARTVRDEATRPPPKQTEADALKAALLWVQDPSEPRRRAAFEAGGRAGGDSPERLAAYAAFFSGGSTAPPDCPAVPAPQQAAGRFSGGAVVLAAIRSGDQANALVRALNAGALIAGMHSDAPLADLGPTYLDIQEC